MIVEWDYTKLADAYLSRPDYSNAAIDSMLSTAKIKPGSKICDVGAGVAHLTLMFAKRGHNVVAVEPNDAMRSNGIKRTEQLTNVSWYKGTGEETGQKDQAYDMVTFGSSFNVCDRALAIKETARILKPKGWFACMWNHRDLTDPIQSQIESIIKKHLNNYSYGTRREDQFSIIESSKLFDSVIHINAKINHKLTVDECVTAWASHATLQRQSGDLFATIIDDISYYLKGLSVESISIPYTTNLWMAQLR